MSAYTSLNAITGATLCVVNGSNKDCYIIIKKHGIWKYNFDKDEWLIILDKQNNFVLFSECCSAALNSNGQQLFILSDDTKLAKLQLSDNSFNIMNDNVVKVGVGAKSIVINNALNVIGGEHNSLHLKWNEEKKIFTKITEIYDNHCLDRFGLVYDKISNCLLLFGGFDNDLNSWSYFSNYILEFNIKEQKWNKLKVSLPKWLDRIGCTLALKSKYVLTFGGWDGRNVCDTIYIYDIKHKTIKESKYKCPKEGIFSAITIHNDLSDQNTVYGYVRNIDIHYFPPFEILNIIKEYFYNEYIYLLDVGDYGNHYKIDALDII